MTDSKGNEILKFVTKDDAYEIVGKLVVGETYTFTEISAPKGFLLAKPVKLTVKDTADVQKVTVKDDRVPNTPEETPQTGKESSNSMPVGLVLLGGLVGIFYFLRRKSLI